MKINRALFTAGAMACMIGLAACGTYVPQLHEVWEEADLNDDLAYRIKKSIYCELRLAVLKEATQTAVYRGQYVDAIPDNWGAQMTLMLQMDETGAANPGASISNISQTFNVAVGAAVSSQASRIDRYYSFFGLKDLKKPFTPDETSCNVDRHGSSPLLSGELGIDAWLKGALVSQNAIPSSPLPAGQATKLDVLSYEVKFIVVTSGTVNPTWKLVNVSASASPSILLSANRTRTHDLLLTMGPATVMAERTAKGVRIVSEPGKQASDLHLSASIGQAVASSLRQNIVP